MLQWLQPSSRPPLRTLASPLQEASLEVFSKGLRCRVLSARPNCITLARQRYYLVSQSSPSDNVAQYSSSCLITVCFDRPTFIGFYRPIYRSTHLSFELPYPKYLPPYIRRTLSWFLTNNLNLKNPKDIYIP